MSKRAVSCLSVFSLIVISLFVYSSKGLQSCNALDTDATSEQLLFGRPILRVASQPATNKLIVREIYELSNNGETKFADWVAYYLDGSSFGNELEAAFATDGCLSEDHTLEATPEDEDDFMLSTSAGYIPTPLAPNTTFAMSEHWQDTQLYSNIVPMHRDLTEAWHELEADIRDYVLRENPVYVITGTAYREEVPRLPRANEDHQVPSGFWKVVYELDPAEEEDEFDTIRYYAVFLDQTGCLSQIESERVTCNSLNQNYTRNPIRIVDIESFTRWDLFNEMENAEEFRVERVFGSLDLTEPKDP